MAWVPKLTAERALCYSANSDADINEKSEEFSVMNVTVSSKSMDFYLHPP